MVYNQFPASCNTVARATNFISRLYYRRYRKNKVEFDQDESILQFPGASLSGDTIDDSGTLYDRFQLIIPKSTDAISGTNKPWTYASLPATYLVELEASPEVWFVSSSPQTTFSIPTTVDNVAKAAIFWCSLYVQMYGYRKVWILDSIGIRPFPIAQLNRDRADTTGRLHDIFTLYIPKDPIALSAAGAQWSYSVTPLEINIPAGYF